ncbi:ATP-binding protein [Limnohabitans sp. yimb22184]|uniref:ATP-binding protein n=1 Tax=Limnohabitans sp. YIMB22184 TaxID=3374104 RepID=UPI003A83527E
MRKRLGFWLGLAVLAVLLLQARLGYAGSAPANEPVTMAVQWCSTSPDLTIDKLLAQTCDWQPLEPSSVVRGWKAQAFWLRLSLHNSSATEAARWLEVGHPQMAQISLYLERPTGWDVRHLGYLTPIAERGAIEKTYGVLPMVLGPHERQTAWMRLSSDTVISLYTALWKPDEFRNTQQLRQFWVSVGIGGMGLIFVFSLMMLALTRQVIYGLFAIGQLGQFLVVSVTEGAFQRFFWPQNLPLSGAIRDVGSLIVLLGMHHFLRAFLPQVHRYPWLLWQMRVSVYATVGLILAGQLDLIDSDAWRFILVVLCGLYATLLSARAWRDGDRAAGIIMVAFISLFGFAVMRLLVLGGVFTFSPNWSLVPFLSIFVCSPLMLLGLVDRTRQLQEEIMRVRAESAAQLRFLAHMSHELRSPLDIVLGNAQLLSREARSAAQVNGLNSIFDSGRQLLRMIDHILDYARGAAGMLKIEPAPLRLGTFVRGIERMARVLAVQRNNRFELVFEGQDLQTLSVRADAERLRQVLSNLLANAARHTSDGLIALKVTARPSDGQAQLQLEFTVSDTGEGISAEEQERIFRPFERADSKANYGGKGAGLGLAIARQLVELMGGRLKVRSAPQQGAQFVFNVPVQRLPEQATSSDERLEGFDAAGYLGPRRAVLVVDDEAVSRNVLSQLLEGLGFEVLRAANGRQAEALLEKRPALDLVLTDQYMPEGDGWLVLERVAEFFPQVPVVLISAAPPSPPPHWNGRLRFAAEFLRPIDHAQLLARIGDLLDLHWSEHAVDHDLRGLPSPVACAPEPSDPALALPDVHHLRDLAKLVELGQVTAIEAWARRLQVEQPGCAPLADHVLQALRQLDLQGLGAFLSAQIEAADTRP